MTDTDRMLAWLREAMDAAEQIARAACEGAEGRWHHLGDQHGGSVAGDHEGYHVAYDEGYPTLEQATHIARHDPAAVLRRITADRQILDDCDDVLHDFVFGAFRQLALDTVCRLAEGYGWTEETALAEQLAELLPADMRAAGIRIEWEEQR